MSATNSKRRHISEGGESSPADMISNLPDYVLSQILNFLPSTKEVVATSILAKRCLAKAEKRYNRFVYKVLKLQQGNIRDFTLAGSYKECNEFDVISWINTAISRGVERLHVDVNFFQSERVKWPISIFSCKTLVDLKIWSLCKPSMNIPSTPIFPCLKKLKVSYCDTRFFKHIVPRCSVLEHLIVSLDSTPIHIVSSSSIKRLELRSTSIGRAGHKIVLCVPFLQYLNVDCDLPTEFLVQEKLSSLIEADIYFCEDRSYSRKVNAKQIRDSFVRSIQTISNVKLLRIRFMCTKFFNSVGHGLFVNLTKLEIVSSYFEWRLLLSLMESSINLGAITLKKISTLKKHKLAWKEPKQVPTCLSSSIRKISIEGYSEDEIPMLKYVLRTAQILEQVDIRCADCYRDDNNWKSDMLQNLHESHRACERCAISLV